MRKLFVTGIGTDVGKTIVSVVLTEALNADYWKPIQCGDIENSDSIKVKRLISNQQSKILKEQFVFKTAASPHYAADIEKVKVQVADFKIPVSQNSNLVIEGAGGLLVPLNSKETILDLIKKTEAEVILVASNYLGSINHTLLSIAILKSCKIPIRALIFSGVSNSESEKVIIEQSGIESFFRIPLIENLNKKSIKLISENMLAV